MPDPIANAMRALSATWRKEAEQRRKRFATDPLADGLESCASEMESELARAEEAMRTLSSAQYARQHNVNPATVRRWCMRGELDGERDGKGDWRIPRTARRHLRRATLKRAG